MPCRARSTSRLFPSGSTSTRRSCRCCCRPCLRSLRRGKSTLSLSCPSPICTTGCARTVLQWWSCCSQAALDEAWSSHLIATCTCSSQRGCRFQAGRPGGVRRGVPAEKQHRELALRVPFAHRVLIRRRAVWCAHVPGCLCVVQNNPDSAAPATS